MGKVNKMKVLNVRNANDALGQGIQLIKESAESVESRAGATLEVLSPVTTVYHKPWERVLISKVRDANPFFHLMEAMWILAGRRDVKFLTEFNKRMVDYSDGGEAFNASYGYRLRNGTGNYKIDQLAEVIKLLKRDPNTRQAVCQIWDEYDLVHNTKDKACNMSIVFRIRDGKLCMTVYNRSNDMIWGAYGANVVQFSIIQEYVAVHLELLIGTYTQVSNSYHVYTEGAGGKVWDRIKDNYDGNINIYNNLDNVIYMSKDSISRIDEDLDTFFKAYDKFGIEELCELKCWRSSYFRLLVMPVLHVYLIYKEHGPIQAMKYTIVIQSDDWRIACEDWLTNRMEAK